MSFQHEPERYGNGSPSTRLPPMGNGPSSTHSPPIGNGYSGSRSPPLDNTTHLLILLVVLIPVIFTIVLCAITYCIYRFNKSRSNRSPTDSPIVSVDRSGAPIATIIYNTQHSPFIFEESPPSYDSLGDIKKDPLGTTTTTTNTNEQLPLTILPNTTLTNTNEEVTATASIILPTAPNPPPPPPPFYVNLDEPNKY